ncbi:MAG: glutathione S-transferase N-terminal domain-containing protein [Glaciecola sp.]
MNGSYIHYATEVSLFSGKTRSYLRYKKIKFNEVLPSASVIKNDIYPNTGLRMIPVIKTPQGEYIQDTTSIIDKLEAIHTNTASVYPRSPTQKLASLLMELYAEEWLIMPAMHYRWHYKRDNLWFILKEFGATAAPALPRFLQPLAAIVPAFYFGRLYKPVLGISKRNMKAIEARYETFLVDLNAHLKNHAYLLGNIPSIADFALIAPLYAHLYRDPFPHKLMEKLAPHVCEWVLRMQSLNTHIHNEHWKSDGTVASSLDNIYKMMFKEQFPVLIETVKRVHTRISEKPNEPLPRFLGKAMFCIDSIPETRYISTYAQWMLQRPIRYYQSLGEEEKEDVDSWLHRVSGFEAMQINIEHAIEKRQNRLHWVNCQ